MSGLADILNRRITIDKIENEFTKEKNISVSMLRLDLIHPVISGNKLFKLYYFFSDAIKSPHKKIITFGGAYSNHLAATAAACKENNLSCIGIVNGSKQEKLSHTLLFCTQMGMQLEFITRNQYSKKNEIPFIKNIKEKCSEYILIPEGGFSTNGVNGAALISNYYKQYNFTHICCATGSGTTLAGLIKSSDPGQQIVGFSAVKNMPDFEMKMKCFTGSDAHKNYELLQAYHFGGFAKKTPTLIDFMNKFFKDHNIPLDFVYTGKMMFGVNDLIRNNYFCEHSKILCIHTGGLQGNLSLLPGTLNF